MLGGVAPHVSLAVLLCLATPVAAQTDQPRAQQNPVTAIDVALEPDAAMLQHAEAANARLREVFPKGYALDATHRPHITMLQRYVRTEDLDKVYAAVADVLAGEKPAGWTLKAFKFDYVVWDRLGLTVMLVEPTDQLIQFQQKLIDAVAPFTVATGTAAAFFTTPEEPGINQPTVDYVARYVPDSSGKNFTPHVTIGVAPPDYVKTLVAEPFDAFTFSPEALSVYQLGNFGTARMKLKEWELNR
jgi:2'-5' RNA ligase